MSTTLWNNLTARYCPSLDASGNGTTTLYNLDGSGNQVGSNNGTLTNMDAATDWVADTSSGGVRALDFDGSNDYVVTPSTSAFNTTSGTVAAWVRPASLTASTFGSNTIFSTANSAETLGFLFGYNLQPGSVRRLQYRRFNADTIYSVTHAPTLDTWLHVALTWGSGSLVLYVAGSSAATLSGLSPVAGSSVAAIGSDSRSNPSQLWHGRIDDVCVFNAAKSAGDIALLASKRGYLLPSSYTPPLINGGLINTGLINGGLVR